MLDMGEPVKIVTLARNLIRLSGYEPDVDIPIVYTGLRPGEKMFEECLKEEEGLQKTGHDKIYIGKPFFDSYDQLQKLLDILRNAVKTEDNDTVKSAVKTVVPTYNPELNKKGSGHSDIKSLNGQEKELAMA